MDIYEAINEISREEITDILDAVSFRFRQLYPEWDISVITTEKAVDKNEQLDRMIGLIQNMKEK